jgi:putative endonuclease
MKKFTSSKQKTGELGETIACQFLKRRGFFIIERNYTKKCGEIDIIARRNDIVHFIEVKSVSCENFDSVSGRLDRHRPEDQAHVRKRKRISRTLEIYFQEHGAGEWQFDLLSVYINHAQKVARVYVLQDLIL